MKRFLGTLCLSVTLLCLAATFQPLHALIIVGPGGKLYSFLDYTGTVTQTTASGAVTTGSVHLSVRSDGKLDGSLTLGGVSTAYTGRLRTSAKRRDTGTGSGYLIPADANGHRIHGTDKIPLIVEKGVFQGGTLDASGTALVLRGTKDLIQPLSLTVPGE